ncbi:MAG: hypothetical protein N4A54_10630 [Peptostreptococcaceae bacterium]|jgi:hypothetical protein|nr:hypothetical protein [Peptostreptococcaceae bacterium]
MKKFLISFFMMFAILFSFNRVEAFDFSDKEKIRILDDDLSYLYLKQGKDYLKLHKSLKNEYEYEYVKDANLLEKLKNIYGEEFKRIDNSYSISYNKDVDKISFDKYVMNISSFLPYAASYYKELDGYNYFYKVRVYEDDVKIISFSIPKESDDYKDRDIYNYYLDVNGQLKKLNIPDDFACYDIYINNDKCIYLSSNKNVIFYDLKTDKVLNLSNKTVNKYNLKLGEDDYFYYLGTSKSNLYYSLNNKLYVFSSKDESIKEINMDNQIDFNNLFGTLYIDKSNNIYVNNENLAGIIDTKRDVYKYLNKDRISNNVDRNKIIGKYKLKSKKDIYVNDYNANENQAKKKFFIPTYQIEGIKGDYIIAENLKNIGFNMVWDNLNNISVFNSNSDIRYKNINMIKNNGNIYDSDVDIIINTWGGYKKLKSYNIGGYSLIALDDVANDIHYFKNELKDNIISGKIYLQDGEIAKEDIFGKIHLYELDYRGSMQFEVKKDFKIPKGQNYIEYNWNLSNEKSKDKYNSLANMNNKKLTYSIDEGSEYVDSFIDIMDNFYEFRESSYVRNNNIRNSDLKILKKEKLKGSIDVSNLKYANDNAYRLLIYNSNSNDFIRYEGDIKNNMIDFDIDVFGLDEYYINLEVSSREYMGSPYGMKAGPPPALRLDGYFYNGKIELNPRNKTIYKFKENDFIKIKY